MKRKATSIWKGNGLEGKGQLSSPSGFFDNTPYSTKMRFENEDGKQGTNPEELLAAAHAGCFNMALSFQVANKGFDADELHTVATVTLEKEKGSDDFGVQEIHLKLKGKVKGMSKEDFEVVARIAKDNCPISKALKAVPISLDIDFEG
ncbi:OsmC family protein [Litoribacter populi]|uniref:OsmC family protein n=1 Tax=Litoribacter populi TaxID=2598460 RepID=UPI00117D9A1D|nr:OsmC family protein [Litoribacter populi]